MFGMGFWLCKPEEVVIHWDPEEITLRRDKCGNGY